MVKNLFWLIDRPALSDFCSGDESVQPKPFTLEK